VLDRLLTREEASLLLEVRQRLLRRPSNTLISHALGIEILTGVCIVRDSCVMIPLRVELRRSWVSGPRNSLKDFKRPYSVHCELSSCIMVFLSGMIEKWSEFCRGNFKKMCRDTFEEFDVDKSGSLSKDEVYPMVLSLYLKIACYTKLANDTIPTRAHVEEVFAVSDADGSGMLSETEFEQFAKFLCQGLVMRITVQLFLQVVICPLLAVYLADYFTSLPALTEVLEVLCSKELYRSLGKTLFTIILNMLLLPISMASIGNLFIFYVGGERERQIKKII